MFVDVNDSTKRDYYAVEEQKFPDVLSGCKVIYFNRFIGRIRKKSTSFMEVDPGAKNKESRQADSA